MTWHRSTHWSVALSVQRRPLIGAHACKIGPSSRGLGLVWTLKVARSTAWRSMSGVGDPSLLLYVLVRGLFEVLNEVLQHAFIVVRPGVHRPRIVIRGVCSVDFQHVVLAKQPIETANRMGSQRVRNT